MRVGLTGGIASGKSAVAARLAEHGAVIIDADVLAREVVAPTAPGFAPVVDRFGTQIVAATGEIDRAALGSLIFSDTAARKDLEAIIHPLVRSRSAQLAAAALARDPQAIVVQVVPLLVEAGIAATFDLVVVVEVDPQLQLQRLRARNPELSLAAAQSRINAQATPAQRREVADWIIDNSGSLAELRSATDELWYYLSGAQTESVRVQP